MAKLIKISPTKAYRVEGIKIKGQDYISIRQMYATAKDPKYKPAKQGITVPDEIRGRLLKSIKSIDDFKELDVD